MPFPNEHAARIKDPDRYERHRREADALGEGISVIWGIKSGETEMQSIRFDVGRFSAQDAQAWLKANEVEPTLFEPAALASLFAEEGKTHEFDAEIFSVGTWNGDPYTKEDLQDMVKNFSLLKEQIKPFLKQGHDRKQEKKILEDGQPALGWVKALRVEGEKLVATFSEVPIIIMKAIKQGLYKRISAEIYWNRVLEGKTYKRVLTAVAMLGATTPAVTNLADLTAYLAQQISSDETGDSFERLATYEFNVEGPEKVGKEEQGGNMPKDIAALEAEVKAYADLDAAKDRKLADKDAELKEYKSREKDAADKAYKEARDATLDEVKTYCDEAVKKGTMTPAAATALCERDVLRYSAEDGPTLSWESIKKYHEALELGFDFSEKGSSKKGEKEGDEKEYATVGEELDDKTKTYMEKHEKTTYEDAMVAVMLADEDLSARYYAKGGDGK